MKQSWEAINEGLWECPYRFSAGITRSLLIKINENKFLAYSPGDKPTAELAKAIIPEDGELFLLAPNTFHNLGLADWKAVYPKAKPVAAIAAIDCLEKKTGIRPENLEALKTALPSHISLVELPHNKIGEVWVDIQMPGERIWAVCDAIFNFSALPSGFMGLLMKLNRMGPGFEMSRMYQYFGISNKKNYGEWMLNEINAKKPSKLIPLHGEICQDADLTERLKGFARKRL